MRRSWAITAFWVALFLLALFCRCYADSVPLKRRSGIYTVQVTFQGGVKRDLYMDSGAAYCCLLHEDLLTARPVGLCYVKEFDVACVGLQLYTVPQMTVGGITLTDVQTTEATMRVLGQSFLGRLASWRVDNKNRTLEMVPRP